MKRKKTWGKPVTLAPRLPLRVLLKRFREAAGLTRQELGERSGTGVDRVIDVEGYGRGCTVTEIHAWSKVLRVNPMSLMG